MASFKQIDIDEACLLIKEANPVIVDIRDEDSFLAGHMQGAVHLSRENLEALVNTGDRTRALLCYCYHGIGSQSAAQFFVDRGFVNVYSLMGGFEAWQNRGEICS